MKTVIKDIDHYISLQPENFRPALEKLRQAIHAIVPGAEEVISYGMPAFKYNGMIGGFAGAKNHCAFYPWDGSTVADFSEALKAFRTSKGAIHFTPEKPIPVALLKKMLKAKILKNQLKATKKATGKTVK